MDALYLLIPIALIFVALALKFFFWSVKSGQYEDLDTEAHRILFDDVEQPNASHPRGSDKLTQDKSTQDKRTQDKSTTIKATTIKDTTIKTEQKK